MIQQVQDLRRRDQRVLNILRVMAQDVAPVRGAKLASALVHRNDIVSFGINQFRSHPLQAKFGKNEDAIFLHSEIDAIRNALNHTTADFLQRCSLFVYRVKRSGGGPRAHWCSGTAHPCEGCTRAIAAFGIRRVINSTNNPLEVEVWQHENS